MHAGCRNACVLKYCYWMQKWKHAITIRSKRYIVANSKPGSQTGRDLSFKLGTTTRYNLKIDNGGLYEFLSEDQHSV